MKKSIESIIKDFDKQFVVPDTKVKDVSFWEEATPKEIKEFFKLCLEEKNREVIKIVRSYKYYKEDERQIAIGVNIIINNIIQDIKDLECVR